MKGGAVLEGVGRVTAVAFDKTGTLTKGRPELTDLETAPGFNRHAVLKLVAAAEEQSEHPIARAIVRARDEAPIETTGRLVEVIRSAVPVAAGATGGHPAKRTFQALRIAVNEELDILDAAVPAILDALHVGGRLVVMSYHSLEDRITKRHLSAWATSTAPPGFPVVLEEHEPVVRVLTRGTEKPTEEEISENRRASSARVRAVEKIRTSRTTA